MHLPVLLLVLFPTVYCNFTPPAPHCPFCLPIYSARRDFHARLAISTKSGYLLLDVASRLEFAFASLIYAVSKYPYEGILCSVKERHRRLQNGRNRRAADSTKRTRSCSAGGFMFFYNRQQRASKSTVVLNILSGLSSGHDEILCELTCKLQAVGGVVAVELEPHLPRRYVFPQ